MTVLRFGALSDCFTFTSTDARATNLNTVFFGNVVVIKEVLSQALLVYLQLLEMS
jgi:hypothetical protein